MATSYETAAETKRPSKLLFWIAVNIIATTAIVFINKSIFDDPSFRGAQVSFATFHFLVTFATLHTVSSTRFGFFDRKRAALRDILPLAAAMCLNVILPNLSLAYSSITFYQTARVLLTPITAFLNYVLYQKTVPSKAVCALVPVCAGVAMVTYFDMGALQQKAQRELDEEKARTRQLQAKLDALQQTVADLRDELRLKQVASDEHSTTSVTGEDTNPQAMMLSPKQEYTIMQQMKPPSPPPTASQEENVREEDTKEKLSDDINRLKREIATLDKKLKVAKNEAASTREDKNDRTNEDYKRLKAELKSQKARKEAQIAKLSAQVEELTTRTIKADTEPNIRANVTSKRAPAERKRKF
ncbi:unnamed protein product [Aureobasidium vineae]|uniref:GDP-mannose transporter n=1 Tax=Aureobasidium vineae TaxID=2773715 RepID=A0A9N8PJ48_9PEZI|nr:unnamed protein product [Aureobasidium vineae]